MNVSRFILGRLYPRAKTHAVPYEHRGLLLQSLDSLDARTIRRLDYMVNNESEPALRKLLFQTIGRLVDETDPNTFLSEMIRLHIGELVTVEEIEQAHKWHLPF